MDDFLTNEARPFNDPSIDAATLERWYPREQPAPEDGVFEIGLVLAGAVSAGAYTAGVLDFLVQALDRWHEAQASDPEVPRHRVRLRAVAGASAGGINGAILAAACRGRFPHVATDADTATRAGNPFYDSWVTRVRIEDLLDTTDLAAGPPMGSVLNCDALDDLAQHTVAFRGEPADPATRAWLADPFRLALTVTDLQGVPFAVRFRGPTQLFHQMVGHRDHLSFDVPVFEDVPAGLTPPDVLRLSRDNGPDRLDWASLARTALATGAFPMALKAREIRRVPTEYEFRFTAVDAAGEWVSAAPWPDPLAPPDVHRFVAVDGGTMNNEPFDIAHDILAGSAGHNPRRGRDASRAVLMIDPFSDPAMPAGEPSASLTAVAGRLLTAMKEQTRFKPNDLALAGAADVYSRFMIAPSRGGHRGADAMASGGLGGFFGFFHEAFRRHDFELGRRNCQHFLRNWFVLPIEGDASNPLFGGGRWTEAARADPRYRSEARPDHAQIIPLVGDLAEPIPRPHWPADAFAGYADVKPLVERRVSEGYPALRDTLLDAFGIENGLSRAAVRAYLWPAWRVAIKGKLLGAVRGALDKAAQDLTARG